ncbi:MAG: hypothetical protein ACO2PO_15165, partial [Candidatus Calescibacterium sp.]
PSSGLIGWYDISMNVSKQYYNDTYSYKSNAFQVRRKPAITSYSINRDSGGWGSYFLVSASVLDADPSDPVNISLWKSYDGVNWVYVDSKSSSDCTGTCYFEFNPSFNCSEYLINSTILLKLNVSDSYSLRNETSPITITLTKDTVSFFSISVPSEVLRYGNNYGKFVVRVYDVDKNAWLDLSQENVKGYFWFTRDTGIYDEGHLVYVNASGYLEYDFNPDCYYNVGYQSWKVGIASNQCYFDANSSDSIFIIKGQLNINLNLPTYGSTFNVGDKINISWNVYSDCYLNSSVRDSGNISEVSNVLTLSSGSYSSICSPINEDNGNYNCTWDSTSKPEGYWNITIQASTIHYSTNTTTFANWFWLENVNATAENFSVYVWNNSINSWQEVGFDDYVGWSNKFNFTADIYDQEGDTVECRLFISKDNGITWNYVGSSIINGIPGIPTIGTCSVVYHGFDCSNIGNNNWFKFEIRDGEQSNYYNTTPINAPKLRESFVSISLISGNGSYVNRSSGVNQIVRFGVNVFDLENSSYAPNANVSFWVTRDGSNYQFDSSNKTEANGNASYYFNPDCSYSTGLQYWKAGVTDYCYIDINTTDFTTYIIGDILPKIVLPNGEEYLRGTNITIRTLLTDECNIALTGAAVNFTMRSEKTLNNYTCDDVVEEGSGYYSCTFNTSSPITLPARWYNITTFANKTFHNTNSTTKYRAFWIETSPILFNPVAIPSGDGGWGETWLFKVNFTDEDLDTNWLRLYVDRGRTTDPSQVAINQTVIGENIEVYFNMSGIFNEDDFNRNRTVKFKFNVTDNPPAGLPEDIYDTDWLYLTLNPDNVTIIPINPVDVVINRNEMKGYPIEYRAQIIDSDRGAPLPGGRTAKIYFTKDGSTFIDSGTLYIASGGYVSRSVTLDCSYSVGPQYWIAGTFNTTPQYAWEIKNSSIVRFDIFTEPLKVNITAPINNYPWNAPVRGKDDIKIYAEVKDDCGYVSGATLTFYVYDPNYGNYTCSDVVDYGNGTYSCTIPAYVTKTWATGWHNISVEVSKMYYNSSTDFQENAFYLATEPIITPEGFPPITGYSISGDGSWGEVWKFEAWIYDPDNDDVNVSLYVNLSSGWVLRNSTIIKAETPQLITFYDTFSCDDIGVRAYKFVATDVWGYSDQKNSTIDIKKDDVSIEYVTGAGEQVRREGNNFVIMKVLVRDIDRNVLVGAGRNGSLYVTTRSLGSSGDTSSYIRYYVNQTDSDSILTFYFDPNCSIGVGIQNWKAGIENDVCYKDTVPEYGFTVNVTGQLKVGIASPTQGSQIIAWDIANVTSFVYSDCSDEGLISGAIVTHEAISPDNRTETIAPVFDLGNGYYNSSWDTSFHIGGLYSFRINASKPNYYPNSTIFANWVYLNNTPPQAENLSVTPTIGGWGSIFSYSVDVYDYQQ